ncbi:PD40 domain-containing protein [Candidatus Poribacteria bacterium]|nr:PD40 domain-containing protein [Candidatus Poribacteria bacterium]
MKTTLVFTLILFTLSLSILLPHVAFAQAQQDERPIVRLIYFRPSDRATHPDIDAKVDALIQDVQRFFADQMETHGFSRKTFLYKTHANGKAVVHHVTGRYTDAYYTGFAFGTGMWGEIDHLHRFSETKDIYLVLTDMSSETYPTFICGSEAGEACGVAVGVESANTSGHALVPIGRCFNIRVIAHELGHVFGLVHDFRNNAFLMSHGTNPNDQNQLSYCAAEWLDVHPAFNPGGIFRPSNTTVKLSASLASQGDAIHLRFEITDPDGLHQVQLIHNRGGDAADVLRDFKGLNGATNSIVEFISTETALVNSRSFQIQCVDINGSYLRDRYTGPTAAWSSQNDSAEFYLQHAKTGNVQQPQSFVDKMSLPEGAKLRLGKGALRDVTYSPDGTRLAVVSSIGIRIYDADTYQELSLLAGHQFDAGQAMFSPDGKMLVTGSNYFTNRLYLWDVETGSLLHTFNGPYNVNARAIYVAFDGQTLISAWKDDTLRFWDIGTGTLTHTVSIPNANHSAMTLIPNKRILAKADTQSDETSLYNIDTGARIRSLKGTSLKNKGVVSDGQILAVLGTKLTGGELVRKAKTASVDLWDVDTGNLIRTVDITQSDNIALSPDGQILAIGYGRTVELQDIDTGRVLQAFTLHNRRWYSGSIHIVKFSPDGQSIICGGVSDILTSWDVSTGDHLHTFPGYTSAITSLAFSPDGQKLASTSLDENIHLWDVNTGHLTRVLENSTQAMDIAFSPDGQILASPGAIGDIYFWDTETGQLSEVLRKHRIVVRSLAFSSDGQTLVSGDYSGAIAVWDVRTKTFRLGIVAHPGEIESVAFSPDGKTIASQMVYREGAPIRLWNAATGHLIQELDKVVSGISFSPVGNTLLLARGGPTPLWDGTDGHLTPRDTVQFDGWPEVAKFSPDGKTIATIEDGLGNEGSTIALWDVDTGNRLRTFAGHSSSASGYYSSLAFGPDGNTLASASWDGTILLWELAPSSAEPPELPADVNGDGEINIQDLVLVSSSLGQVDETAADVNGDGEVNIQDLVAVAAAIGQDTAAPAALRQQATGHLTTADVQHWIELAQQLDLTAPRTQRGLLFLQYLLAALTPQETILLANYPNPFNPETWIPYQLAKPADVTLTIYDIQGRVVRDLNLGHQRAGVYQAKSRAAYWDGKNAVGEPVASGVYFYTLTAGDFNATRKMLIRK